MVKYVKKNYAQKLRKNEEKVEKLKIPNRQEDFQQKITINKTSSANLSFHFHPAKSVIILSTLENHQQKKCKFSRKGIQKSQD